MPVKSDLPTRTQLDEYPSPALRVSSSPFDVLGARTTLPLPMRKEWREGRGEGHPIADTRAHLPTQQPSTPQPSPPSAGGEGDEIVALKEDASLRGKRAALSLKHP